MRLTKTDRSSFDPQVGDLVRIRLWEDMEEEFGLDCCGSIACTFCFNEAMRRNLEGREFQITAISGGQYHGHGTGWAISKDMLEPCECDEDDEIETDSEEINGFLSSFKIV